MAKIKFREIKMSAANKRRLDLINGIIEEYQAQGYVLTLRQLYYQLVSRDIIPNKQAEYSKLSNLLKEGRMAGIVDWEAIEDRLADEYDIQLPEGDYQTVAGLILDRLARIPHQGQIINVEGYRIQVLQVTDRKILKVKIHRIKPRGNV